MKFVNALLKSLTFGYIIVTIINNLSGRNRKILQRFASNFVGMVALNGKVAIEGLKTQSMIRTESKPIKFVQGNDNKIYWIEDNQIFYTEIVNDQVDMSKGILLDTSMLSEEEVVEIIEILGALRSQ